MLLLFGPTLSYCQQLEITITHSLKGQSFRGLSVVDDQVAWVSGTNGRIGVSRDGGKTWSMRLVSGHEKSDFRSVYAFDSATAVIANAGSPAHILITKDAGRSWEIVYTNDHPDAFIDGVDFWDENQGIIYGDPIANRMLLIRTADGGKTWTEFPIESRPVLEKGEASFAASGTGIRCLRSGQLVVVTGGSVSRHFYSGNYGVKWYSTKTPILQGESSRGIFSIAYAGPTRGIIVGGDYNLDSLKTDHVFYTTDSGKSWIRPQKATGGYRECVEFVNEKVAVAVGPGGIDVTWNSGVSWESLSREKLFHVARKARNGSLLLLAGGNGRIARVYLKG